MPTTTQKKTSSKKSLENTQFEGFRHSKYLPIENYGVIGDLHTAALVGLNGSIDWYCLPHFDSPSVFGRILDAEKGGYFQIAPVERATHRQMYFPDTCILQTRFLSEAGVGEINDFMPVEANHDANKNHDHVHLHQIYRHLKVVRGEMKFRMECVPAFNYGRDENKIEISKKRALFKSKKMTLALHSEIPLKKAGVGVGIEFILKAGESCTFVLRQVEEGPRKELYAKPIDGEAEFHETVKYWRNWISQCQYRGRWREVVNRSALTLKLLTFIPTGALVAAATTSLPEEIGGVRNWDYRFTWIRDASFTLYALLRLGFSKEAGHFMRWIQHRIEEVEPDGALQIMYGLHGEHNLKEKHLSHWEGYMESKPVNIGNAAYAQLQMDIYGELMDSVYLYNKYGNPISHELWKNLTRILEYVCKNWKKKDHGIWEARTQPQHYVYSKLMCWVALDRGLRLAEKRSFPADRERWGRIRDEIYQDIMKNGWSQKRKAFVQHYGSDRLDAANLIMPLVKFISPTDPKMISTLKATSKALVWDTLVHRYALKDGHTDGVKGKEGTFSMCTFWYVEALARAGYVQEARYIFENMLGYANHLGLYSEEIGPTGEALGNFPQAFTHLGLISAAYNLDKALDKKGHH